MRPPLWVAWRIESDGGFGFWTGQISKYVKIKRSRAGSRNGLTVCPAHEEPQLRHVTGFLAGAESSLAEKIRCAYGDETVKFRWEAGDVMLLDNMSVSHAREPYKGPRDVVVCLTNAYDGSATLSGV